MGENTNTLSRQTGKRFFSQVPVIFWGLIALIVILGFVSPNSVQPKHLLDFTRQAAPMIIVGIGQMIVMMVGGLDLSIAAVMVFVDVVAADLMAGKPQNAVWVAILCVGLGAVIGLANGFLCAKLKMPAFVVTLAMSILLLGITLIYCGGAPKGSIPDNFRFLGTGFVGVIPTALFVWGIIAAIIIVVMKLLPIGRYIQATGVNARAVYQSGLNHVKIQMLCYMLCGILAALGGLQISAYIGTGTMEFGIDYQMDSIAVALLGGASFAGGKGSIPGTIFAGLFMVVMMSLISAMNMDVGDRAIVQGIIILAALIINGLKKD
ncbi:MAG: ABC transporter permease [Christensenellaceae bacterium]|jgi:ribose transport system permease protein